MPGKEGGVCWVNRSGELAGDSADTRRRRERRAPSRPLAVGRVPLLAGSRNARSNRPLRSTSRGLPSSPQQPSGNHLRIGRMEHRLARQPFIILCHPPRFLLGKITAGHCGITSLARRAPFRRLADQPPPPATRLSRAARHANTFSAAFWPPLLAYISLLRRRTSRCRV